MFPVGRSPLHQAACSQHDCLRLASFTLYSDILTVSSVRQRVAGVTPPEIVVVHPQNCQVWTHRQGGRKLALHNTWQVHYCGVSSIIMKLFQTCVFFNNHENVPDTRRFSQSKKPPHSIVAPVVRHIAHDGTRSVHQVRSCMHGWLPRASVSTY